MDEKMQAFVTEGLKKYAEGWKALRAFEAEVERILVASLDERSAWRVFKPSGAPAKFAKGNASVWLSGSLTGKVKDQETVIELGLWWEPPGPGLALVAYANFWKGPAEITRFAPRPTGNVRLRTGTLNAKSRVLLTEPGPDLREDFDLLLDGLEAQVA